MFEDSTFESTGRIHTRSRRWMIATLALNGSILLALILIPLIYPEALPRQVLTILLEVPAAPSHPQPPPRQAVTQFHGVSELSDGHIFAPSKIPQYISMFQGPEAEPAANFTSLGDDAGIPGGNNEIFRGGKTLPVVRPENKGPVHISSGVMTGLLIQKTVPAYPPIPREARIQGTVVLQATISKIGTIENLRAAGGPAMLQQAALDAVKTWRYRPYLLNGQPVEVETTVNVVFTLDR
jgi:protein TonB